jgi:hypothetical protein
MQTFTYNPKSSDANEFINHNEILDTLIYAEAHKNDSELIDSLLRRQDRNTTRTAVRVQD